MENRISRIRIHDHRLTVILTGDLFLFQQIPTSFTKFFNGVLPLKVTLVDHGRRSWGVDLGKTEGRLVVKDGWPEFGKAEGLEDGAFL